MGIASSVLGRPEHRQKLAVLVVRSLQVVQAWLQHHRAGAAAPFPAEFVELVALVLGLVVEAEREVVQQLGLVAELEQQVEGKLVQVLFHLLFLLLLSPENPVLFEALLPAQVVGYVRTRCLTMKT